MVQEEHLHQIHGEGWVRRLARTGGAVRKTLIASLSRFWDETLCWFGPSDDATMQRLFDEKIIDASPDELRNRYLQKIMPTLNSLNIEVSVAFNAGAQRWELTQPLPWTRWNATSRRLE